MHPYSTDTGHISVSKLSPCKGSVGVETLSWPLLASSHTVAHLSGPCFAVRSRLQPAAPAARGCDPRPSSRCTWGALGAIATQLTGTPLPAPLLTLPGHPPAPRPPRSGKPRPPAVPGQQRRKGARKRSGSPGSAAARRGGERQPLARPGPGSRTRSRLEVRPSSVAPDPAESQIGRAHV